MYMYFAIKDGAPVIHTDLEEMVKLGFPAAKFTDDSDKFRKMTENQFIGLYRTVKAVGGKLVFGLTEKELAEMEAKDRIGIINIRLQEIDRDFGNRYIRDWHISNNTKMNANARQQLEEAEALAASLREERAELEKLFK